MPDLPHLGVGLGYRPQLRDQARAHLDRIDWFEILTDDYLGRPDLLDEVRQLGRPICCHGQEMSVGSEEPLDHEYVEQVAAVADAVAAPWVSDHLCFTREGGIRVGSLTPVVRTRQRARSIAAKAQQVQQRLGRPFLLENIAYLVDLPGELTELELINEVFEHCDCGLLLDLNNLAVNATNHRFDPDDFLTRLPLERVVEVHLAGNSGDAQIDGLRLDGHDAAVGEEVFTLLARLTAEHAVRAVLIERDRCFPEDFDEIAGDLDRARATVAGASAR